MSKPAVRRSRIYGLSFYFLPVFEGEPDVVLGIDRDVVHQPVPSFQREFRQLIRQPFKGLQKGFVIGTLGLFLADLLGDFLKASLGLVEALRQGVVPFLVTRNKEKRLCSYTVRIGTLRNNLTLKV